MPAIESDTTYVPVAVPGTADPTAPGTIPRLPPGLEATVRLAMQAALALATEAAQPVSWVPGWSQARAEPVRGEGHLAALIAGLAEGDFSGIQIEGSRGPWCQVKNVGIGEAEFLIELHPHVHDEPGVPMLFERVVPVDAVTAGAFGWAWVHGKGLPDGYQLEARIVPLGRQYDEAL